MTICLPVGFSGLSSGTSLFVLVVICCVLYLPSCSGLNLNLKTKTSVHVGVNSYVLGV